MSGLSGSAYTIDVSLSPCSPLTTRFSAAFTALVVGTKGKKASFRQNLGLGIGSVSKYCVAHSPVPVIVVR